MTSPFPTADLEHAAALHEAGRLNEAGAIYQRILTAKPKALTAVHGLALIALDLGEPDRAMPLLARCIATDPKNGLYRASFGLALLRKENFEEAAAHLLEAVNLAPLVLEPRLYLARALGRLGRWSQAVDVLGASATLFKDSAQIWAAKGNAERALERYTDAEASLRRALVLAPDDADTLNNLGVVTRALGRKQEAIDYYRAALAIAPTRAVIHSNLGNVYAARGQNDLAETHLREAVLLAPDTVEPRTNLAAFLTNEQRGREAIPQFRAILTAAPGNVDAWTNLGVALLDEGDVAEAETAYLRAIALSLQNGEAHYNLAWLLLLTGRWKEGWREYEWRWALTNFSSRKRKFAQPMWDGSNLKNGTLLLHAEQGLGDAIQFVRYAALAKTRCARVVVECPQPLLRLFKSIPGIDQVIAAGSALPIFDAHAPFMSLPHVFGTTTETVPSPDPYLKAPAEIPEHLRLPTSSRPRIGLVWAGSPDNKIDRRRTLPARIFAPLVETADAGFVSLQVGPGASEATDLPTAKMIFTCDGKVSDFADTATVAAQLDLVIGVDTAVMHLAAAMGKPVWMLLPFMPDYRWLLAREDSPWYAGLRLFRQRKGERWEDVLTRLAGTLTNWQRRLG